ncbi:Interleukin-5 receptor subunit alpha [Chelonia mydas]|uniref:Interleukin-5 receptor subunit alpha n=1 Tax=Chelonia mydas TaxID=8469 RepID=M7BB72_CHEMY|nr:Interleukin-5 receptor subunit alpha [Chelonia mydas]
MAILVSIFPVLLWTMMAFQANLLQAKGIQVLPPVNFTLTVSALAEVLLQWKPNPDQEEKNYTIRYDVEIMTPERDEYDTKKTCSTRVTVLHNGFSARIRTLLLYTNSQIKSNWVTAKLQAPPGAVETSVTNLSCVIYTAINNTASLHCTWLAGKAAPEDTKYFLFYRYNNYTDECQEYSKDKWERNIGCRFSNTYIKTSETDEVIVIHVNGSSNGTAIKPFEQIFDQNAILQVLPPVNFTLTVSALAEVLLQWKPNPDQEEKNYTIRYDVEIMTPERDEYDTKKTCSTRVTVLHNGFSARIRTLLLYTNSQIKSNWVTAKLQAPPGAVETSVTNLSCVIYTAINNTASLHCAWLAGKAAPEDTKYFLFYRYNNYTDECQEYSKDKWERNIGCRFSNTYIKTSETDEVIVIHINGSSNGTAIKPFEQIFNQNAIQKVNPPRNVTMSLKQNNLLVKWEMPASSFLKECFKYELNIYNWKMGYKQILETELNSFSLRIDDTCRYSIQIRANHQSWCTEGFWSDWTEPLYIGSTLVTLANVGSAEDNWVNFSLLVCGELIRHELAYVNELFVRQLRDRTPVTSVKLLLLTSELNLAKWNYSCKSGLKNLSPIAAFVLR